MTETLLVPHLRDSQINCNVISGDHERGRKESDYVSERQMWAMGEFMLRGVGGGSSGCLTTY